MSREGHKEETFMKKNMARQKNLLTRNPILFGTNFGVGQNHFLSLRERARVRRSNKESYSYFPSS